MNFSDKEVSEFIDVFVKNNVKIEFESSENFLKCIEEFTRKSENKILRNKFDNTIFTSLKEYDIFDNLKIVSTGYAHHNRFYGYCPVKNVGQCIDILMELFDSFDISECVLDFMHSYMLMYRGNGKYKEYEGVYFWINHGILRRKSIEEKKHFLEMLFIDKNHIDFICQGEAKFKFDYIGFNHKNMIAKYAIAMKCLTFLEANPSQYYENYVNIKSVSSIIEKSSPYLIDIQLVPGKPKYIAIEYAVGETLEKTIDDLLKYKLIDESLAKKILSHDYLEYKDQFVIKFRWEDENNYTIKLYAEKKHV